MSAVTFRDVYLSEREFVWRTLARLGIPARHLEDLTHDVFVAIHGALPSYDVSRPLRPWVFVITHRAARDFRQRADNARVELTNGVDDHAAFDSGPSPESQIEANAKRIRLQHALAQLDADQRAVFVMHDLEDTTMPDIAAALEIPLNTAYSRLRLARTKLARSLAADSTRPGAESHP